MLFALFFFQFHLLAIPFGFSKSLLDCVIGFWEKEGGWVPDFTSIYSEKKADYSGSSPQSSGIIPHSGRHL